MFPMFHSNGGAKNVWVGYVTIPRKFKEPITWFMIVQAFFVQLLLVELSSSLVVRLVLSYHSKWNTSNLGIPLQPPLLNLAWVTMLLDKDTTFLNVAAVGPKGKATTSDITVLEFRNPRLGNHHVLARYYAKCNTLLRHCQCYAVFFKSYSYSATWSTSSWHQRCCTQSPSGWNIASSLPPLCHHPQCMIGIIRNISHKIGPSYIPTIKDETVPRELLQDTRKRPRS